MSSLKLFILVSWLLFILGLGFYVFVLTLISVEWMKCRLKMPFSYNLPGAHVLLLAGGPTAQYNTLSSSAQTSLSTKSLIYCRSAWRLDPRLVCCLPDSYIYIYIPVYVLCHAFRKNFIATARFKQYTVVARTFVLCTIGLKVAYFIRCINSILNIYLLFQVLY